MGAKDLRKAGAALLGTPAGLKVAWMLGLRREEIGKKVLDSITIFKDNECPIVANGPECQPTIVFSFRPASSRLSNKGDISKWLDQDFPDLIRLSLVPKNPYSVLANNGRPTREEWEDYWSAELDGRLDEDGQPTNTIWGTGPARAVDFYNGIKEELRTRWLLGYLRRARYAKPAAGTKHTGPKAGIQMASGLEDFSVPISLGKVNSGGVPGNLNLTGGSSASGDRGEGSSRGGQGNREPAEGSQGPGYLIIPVFTDSPNHDHEYNDVDMHGNVDSDVDAEGNADSLYDAPPH